MNKMSAIQQTALFFGLLFLSAAPACAGQATPSWVSPFYATASVGQVSVYSEDPPRVYEDHTDTAYTLGLGYTFNKNFSFEVGYADLGETTGTLGAPGTTTVRSGLYFCPILTLPVTETFAVFGKYGLFAWDAEGHSNIGVAPSASGTNTFCSVGFAYALSEAFTVKTEWSRYNSVGTPDTTGSVDFDYFSLGLICKFGKLL